jgi:polyphosphate kinase 2 PPK2
MADITERALWAKYQAAYQEVIRHTSSKAAPWHVVPADHKWFARVVIGSTIVSALDRLDLKFPKADPASLQEFKQVRQALELEGKAGAKKAAVRKA